MPFNGNGVYVATSLPGSWNPATTGSSATPTDWNTLLADISTALSTTITKDGQTTVTADIPMATHKITGLGDATALTDALNQQGAWFVIDAQDITAAATADFINIPTTINHLMMMFEVLPSAGPVDLALRTYGADGALDTGSSDYNFILTQVDTTPGTGVTASASSAYGTIAFQASNVAVGGVGGRVEVANIQALTYTKFTFQTTFFSFVGTVAQSTAGGAMRQEADRISGVQLLVSSGTMTGKVTLYGSV